MSRKERRKEPALTPKERVELSQKNIPLRIVLVVLALVAAAVCFANALGEMGKVQPGWQEILATNPMTAAPQDFVLTYNLGAGSLSPKAEQQKVSELYTRVLDETSQALSNQAVSGVNNLHTLNRQPNADIQVEPELYAAFRVLENAGSRMAYYAPVAEQYDALFSCTYDEEAVQFDPQRDKAAGEFAARIAAFAKDSDAVQVRLLPDNTLRLEVSQEYLDYARESGVETFVDFGILRNALLCDAAADALVQAGYIQGVLSSLDGYARSLNGEEFALNIFERQNGKIKNVGIVNYSGPAALVSFRAFPATESDMVNYYTYSDGTVICPYLNEDGISHASAGMLAGLSPSGTAASLALRLLPVFTGEAGGEKALDDLSWVMSRDGVVQIHGTGFVRK